MKTIATFGLCVETFEFTIWDLLRVIRIPGLRENYYQNTDEVIFVVDSNDRQRIEEARQELMTVLTYDQLREALLIVFANKMDLSKTMSIREISDKLGLNDIKATNGLFKILALSVVKAFMKDFNGFQITLKMLNKCFLHLMQNFYQLIYFIIHILK